MTQDWRTLTREQLDWAYDQRQHAANMQAVLTELAQAGEATQARLNQRHQRIAYGADPVTRMDVYANGSPDAPVLFFIHGGAWKSGQARDYAFFVEWVLQAGLDVVIPDFSAVQDVGGDLTVLQRQLSQALTQVLNTLTGTQRSVHLCGHSSGAHLAACLAVAHADSAALRSLTVCSGIYDLEPVSRSARSQYVNFTAETIDALSPLRHAAQLRVPVQILCGTQESPEFIRQAQAFHATLQAQAVPSSLKLGPDLNHFEILQTLQSPEGWLSQQLRQAF